MHSSLQPVSQFCTPWALPALLRAQNGSHWAWGSTAATSAQRGALFSSSSSSGIDAAGAEAAPQQEQQQEQQQQQQPLLYAACVLERLPIVKSPPPAAEAEVKAQLTLLRMQANKLKQYPSLDAKQRDRDAAQSKEASTAADAAQVSTAADASGAVNTMKRRLQEKLVLLVKTQHNAMSQASAPGSTAAAAGNGGGSSSGAWTFPHTPHKSGETMRQAAERALKETIGLSQVYFVGNAPMAHMDISSSSSPDSSSSSPDSSNSSSAPAAPPEKQVFFHLAQVVNDPWDVQLLDGVASDFAWVSREELGQYITDSRLLQLAHKML